VVRQCFGKNTIKDFQDILVHLQIMLIVVKFIMVMIMRKDEKDDLSWKIFRLWIAIPRSIRLAFLWSILIGFSYFRLGKNHT